MADYHVGKEENEILKARNGIDPYEFRKVFEREPAFPSSGRSGLTRQEYYELEMFKCVVARANKSVDRDEHGDDVMDNMFIADEREAVEYACSLADDFIDRQAFYEYAKRYDVS